MRPWALVSLWCVAALGCTGPSAERDTIAVRPSPDSSRRPYEFWADVGIPFHPDSVSVGDTIGSMIVDRIAVERAYDSSAVGSVGFRGELELKGRMRPHTDSDVHAKCFEADTVSASRMPRWKGDLRRPWFCFSNQEDSRVAKALVPSEATILIDHFTIHLTMSDVVNEARLRRIVTPH